MQARLSAAGTGQPSSIRSSNAGRSTHRQQAHAGRPATCTGEFKSLAVLACLPNCCTLTYQQ
jgi:hypothetical protein